MKVSINKGNLPKDREAAINMIYYHFSNHKIDLTESSDYFHLELNRSTFMYCENTTKKLEIFGINEKDVLNYFILEPKGIFCLLESWIPLGWSYFFSITNKVPKNLTVIHLDDHSDLMAPQISVDDKGNWNDMFTGRKINFTAPESIKKAIESGAITLGSILTILVHYIENLNILHFKQNSETILRYIGKMTENEGLITTEQKRMSVATTRNPKQNAGKYLRTSDIYKIIQNIPDEDEIFLHIDMDFFNNRFNGSSDWKQRLKHDPNLEQQKKIIKSFCIAISKPKILNRIVHVSIGVSPSFYPSEYWKEGITYLLSELENIQLNMFPQIKFKERKDWSYE